MSNTFSEEKFSLLSNKKILPDNRNIELPLTINKWATNNNVMSFVVQKLFPWTMIFCCFEQQTGLDMFNIFCRFLGQIESDTG